MRKSAIVTCVSRIALLLLLCRPLPALAGNTLTIAEDRPATAANSDQSPFIDLSDAIRKTMQLQPAILLQKETVGSNAGILRSSAGDFDWRLESFTTYSQDYAPIPSYGSYKKQDTVVAGLKLGKLFRRGVYFEPNLQYSQSEVDVKEEYLRGQANPPVQKSARLGFLLRVPLLQGYGEKNTAVREIAATYELDAARLNLLFRISQSVQDTALAYWNYRAAQVRLEVLKESEARASAILEKTDALVKADEVAAAEIQNVKANLADKAGSRISAELALSEARTKLGQAIGIPYRQIPQLPLPSGSFPLLDKKLLVHKLSDADAYCMLALDTRHDLLALRKQIEAGGAQVTAARDQTKPALNLELSVGADGVISGSGFQRTMQTLENRQSAPDWSAGFRVVYPLGNNAARGNLEQALSRYNQGRIQLMESERTVQSTIMFTLSSLLSSAREIEKADEAVRTYEVAVENEREKYLMGEATLLDLLYIQDRLDAALLNRISALQRAATNLTRLRFEAGKLVRFENGEGRVDVEDLTTLLVP